MCNLLEDHDSTPNNPDRPTPLPSKRDAEDRPSDYALVNKRTRLEGDDQGKASDSRNFTPGLASNAPLSGHGGAKLGYTVDLVRFYPLRQMYYCLILGQNPKGSQLRKSSLPVDAASLSKTPSRNSMATSRSTPTSESAMSSVSSPFTPSLFGRSDNNSRIDSVSVERENTPQTEQWDSKVCSN